MSASGILVADLTTAEARALTDQIKDTTQRLYALVLDAYERRAWLALGYPSWRTYVQTEFAMSKSHAYRLLDHGRVVRALEQAAGFSPIGEISEYDARQIKPQLAVVTHDISGRVAMGEDPSTAVVASIDGVAKARQSYRDGRKPENLSNRIVETIVGQAKYLWKKFPKKGKSSRVCVSTWPHSIVPVCPNGYVNCGRPHTTSPVLQPGWSARRSDESFRDERQRNIQVAMNHARTAEEKQWPATRQTWYRPVIGDSDERNQRN